MKMNKKMITMKTIYILTAFIGLQFNTLFAAGNPETMIIKASTEILDFSTLAPLTPKEADFNDEAPAMEMNLKFLAPLTPKEATFEDVQPDENPGSVLIPQDILQKLAPLTPVEADFSELV